MLKFNLKQSYCCTAVDGQLPICSTVTTING